MRRSDTRRSPPPFPERGNPHGTQAKIEKTICVVNMLPWSAPPPGAAGEGHSPLSIRPTQENSGNSEIPGTANLIRMKLSRGPRRFPRDFIQSSGYALNMRLLFIGQTSTRHLVQMRRFRVPMQVTARMRYTIRVRGAWISQ